MKDPAKMSKQELRNEVYKLQWESVEWVGLDDRYPDEEGIYLCAFSDGTVETMQYIEDGEPWEAGGEFVMYWAEVPQHPDVAKHR